MAEGSLRSRSPFTATSKIANPHAFAKIVWNYKLLPDNLVTLVAVFMPWLEIIAGLFLVAGLFKKPSAFALSGLLMVFIIAISINLARGLEFDCGCFTTIAGASSSDPVGLLIRDILILIPGLIIMIFGKEKAKEKV